MDNAATSDMTNIVKDVTIDPLQVDQAGDTGETTWMNTEWTQQWGDFNTQADLKTAITLKSMWLLGKGYTTDAKTQVELEFIKGMGKDTFYDIMLNQDIISRVGGDSYAQIVPGPDGITRNLIPLNPGKMRLVFGTKGNLKRYEYLTTKGKKTTVEKFKIEEIFQLSNFRLANQMHGISDIKALRKTIEADNESFVDTRKIMHHQAKPFILWKLKTDDQSRVNRFMARVDAARNISEDLAIPDDDAMISYEVIKLEPSASIFLWRDELRNKFYRNIMMPQIVPGAGGQGTESDSKVIYMTHEQIVAYWQLQREKQIYQQLHIKLKFTPPASMTPDLAADEGKDLNTGFQPSETQVTQAAPPAAPGVIPSG